MTASRSRRSRHKRRLFPASRPVLWTGSIILSFLFLIAASLAALQLYTPRIKAELISGIKKSSGLEPKIEKLRIGLTGNVYIQGLWLSHEGNPLLSLRGVHASFGIIPLLRRRIIFKKIRIEDPQIHILRDEKGRTNWHSMMEALMKTGGQKPGWEITLLMKKMQIQTSGGKIWFSDKKSGLSTEAAANLDFSVSQNYLRKTVLEGQISLRNIKLKTAMRPVSRFLKFYAELTTQDNGFILELLTLRSEKIYITAQGEYKNWAGVPDLRVRILSTKFLLEEFSDWFAPAEIRGDGQFQAEFRYRPSGLEYNGELQVNRGRVTSPFQVKPGVRPKNPGFSLAGVSPGFTLENINCDLAFNEKEVRLKTLTFGWGENYFNSHGAYSVPDSRFNLDAYTTLSVPGKVKNLSLLQDCGLNLHLEGPVNELLLSGKGDLKFGGFDFNMNLHNLARLDLNSINLTLPGFKMNCRGETDITGFNSLEMDLSLERFSLKECAPWLKLPSSDFNAEISGDWRLTKSGKTLSLTGRADVRELTVAGGDGKPLKAAGIITLSALPDSTFDNYPELNGALGLSRIKLNENSLPDVTAVYQVNISEILLRNLSFAGYGGKGSGQASIKIKPGVFPYTMELNLKDMDLAGIRAGLNLPPGLPSGRMDAKLRAAGELKSEGNASARGEIKITGGGIENVSFLKDISNAVDIPSLQNIKFDLLTLNFIMDKETFSVTDSFLQAPQLNGTLQLKVSFPEKIEGRINTNLSRSLLKESPKFKLLLSLIGEKGEELPFEFIVGGRLKAPRIEWVKGRLEQKILRLIGEDRRKKEEKSIEQMMKELMKNE